MGLFSFLKKAGSNIFKSSEERAAEAAAEAAAVKQQRLVALKGVIDGLGLPITDLDLDLADDQVTVYGQTESQADKEKIILALGNVAGVATVDDRISVVTPAPEAQFYEVQSGDSLSKIALKYYDDAMKYPVIFEANKPMLEHPDKIYPGQVLRIPPLEG
ncbi:MAG: peptidoglycan-binding protein LysM [Saprospiraceae bacterium]|nr:peptidoglycan-binding protein LysM [Saprospiraceae bacterium]